MATYVASDMLAGDMILLELCRIYGWSWHDLQTQPTAFTDLALEKLRVDNQMAEQRARASVRTL